MEVSAYWTWSSILLRLLTDFVVLQVVLSRLLDSSDLQQTYCRCLPCMVPKMSFLISADLVFNILRSLGVCSGVLWYYLLVLVNEGDGEQYCDG